MQMKLERKKNHPKPNENHKWKLKGSAQRQNIIKIISENSKGQARRQQQE